jgi:DNA-binding NarL/FixJ family response regulator
MKSIRMIVVDDHALFRAGLISLLSEMEGLEILGEAGDGESGVQLARSKKPDLVLMDVNMPGMGGVEAVRQLRKTETCRILMLTISRNDEDLFGAIAAGADGYILKDAEPEELRQTIMLVAQGMFVLSQQVTRQVVRAIGNDQNRITDSGLSSREMEVLECLAQGKTTIQIAGKLYISENTVKTHVRHILEKLEASNRAEAVSKALQMGFIRQEN